MVAEPRPPATWLLFANPLDPGLKEPPQTQVSVPDADCGPSEMTCKKCGRLMLFTGEHATLRGHIGLSSWRCPHCWRDVLVSWGKV